MTHKTMKIMCASTLSLMMALGSAQVTFAQDSSNSATEDVVIATGTLIRRQAQADRASPVLSIGEVDIGSTGAKSIADLTQTLTINTCLLYTSPSPRDKRQSRMPSSA